EIPRWADKSSPFIPTDGPRQILSQLRPDQETCIKEIPRWADQSSPFIPTDGPRQTLRQLHPDQETCIKEIPRWADKSSPFKRFLAGLTSLVHSYLLMAPDKH
ncbi:unnamed protein product, partial [Lymnaea stagnalis]